MTASRPTTPTRPAEVTLTTDLLEGLTPRERALLPLLFDACQEMDQIFWQEAAGDDREKVLSAIDDPDLRSLVDFNFGPWDRRKGNAPLLAGVGQKPAGASFYPPDMDANEFESACGESPERAAALRSPHSVVRRDGTGRLVAVAYHDAFAPHVERAASKLRKAAGLADDPTLRTYLELRAAALLADDYRASEVAWLLAKDAAIDLVIGPVETYEDGLFGRKTAHEGILTLRDSERTARVERLTTLLPRLQAGLPVADAYKVEMPGLDGGIGIYDVLAYAGDAHVQAPAAFNLPNDEGIQVEHGTRRVQLRNAMRAGFELLTGPIAARVIAADQRADVEFEAYFAFVLCHEIAHGLGVKRTIDGRSVSDALIDQHDAVEEGKADVVGMHILARLINWGELNDTALMPCYVIFAARLIRQIRYGPASGYARASLASLEVLLAAGAIRRDDTSGTYSVNGPLMRDAIDSLAGRYLRLQGDGDHASALAFIPMAMDLTPALRADLERLDAMGIPNAIRNWPAIDRHTGDPASRR